MSLNGATHDRYDSNPPPTERDPKMVAPETLSAIDRELAALGAHSANLERQMGSFRKAVWDELKEQEKARRLDSEKLSELKIRFHQFEDKATQALSLQNGLLEQILRKLNQA